MIEAYKILINNALQRYHFELANRGVTKDESLRNSLRGAIMGLYNCALGSDDREALEELKSIMPELFEGEIVEPYFTGVAA